MFTKTEIEKYFLAEKAESFVFMAIGLTGLVTAIVFYFLLKTPSYKGAAIPILVIGLLLFSVGYTIFKRSVPDIARVTTQLKEDPATMIQQELSRMEKVMQNFVFYRYVEIILALAGLTLWLYFKKVQSNPFWSGFGIGLLVMAALALSADYFAEKRGNIYLRSIKESNLAAPN